jgi:hypothetical protein
VGPDAEADEAGRQHGQDHQPITDQLGLARRPGIMVDIAPAAGRKMM